MSEAAVRRAVNYWRRRHPPMPAFDADDAAQEARIAIWRTGRDHSFTAYSGIFDAIKALERGYRHRAPIATVPIEDALHLPSPEPGPEELAAQNECLRRVPQVLTRGELGAVRAVLSGEPSTAIARRAGVTQSAVSHWLASACRKLEAAHAHGTA